jgi:chitinase
MLPRLTSLLRPLAFLSVGGALFLMIASWADPDGAAGAAGASGGPRVVGYVTGAADVDRADARRLTHVNYAFAQVTDSARIVFRDDEAGADLARLQALKARNPDLKLLASVGGWGAKNFSDAALTARSRAAFAESAAALVERYRLDGVDVDWEFPGQPGPGTTFREADRTNFTLLLEATRARIDSLSEAHGRTGDDRYLLTIAGNDDRTYFETTEVSEVHPLLDFINVMTYDFFSRGSSTTGHHAGLYRSPAPGASSRTTAAAVERYLEAGVPARKVVVGVPFYGRGWTGVAPQNQGLFQPFERFTRAYSYDLLQRRYINQRGFDRSWDPSAKAPYLWNADSTTFISYEDPKSLRHKASFVRERGLGGVMYWQHGHDPDRKLLGVLHRALRRPAAASSSGGH